MIMHLKVGDNVAKHPTVEYTDLSESIDLDRIAINIDSAMFKKLIIL